MMLVWKLWKSALESLSEAPPVPRSGRIRRRPARRAGVPPGRHVSSPRNDGGPRSSTWGFRPRARRPRLRRFPLEQARSTSASGRVACPWSWAGSRAPSAGRAGKKNRRDRSRRPCP